MRGYSQGHLCEGLRDQRDDRQQGAWEGGWLQLPPRVLCDLHYKGDAIGRGHALNRIERTVAETGESFGDGSHIVYVSSTLADEGTELGHLMHDLRCSDPDKMHYNELREMVSYYSAPVRCI